MTNSSHGNMLNDNIYSKMMADRERIRNQLIDRLGRKPTEDEIDEIRLAASEQAQNYEQSQPQAAQQPAPRY